MQLFNSNQQTISTCDRAIEPWEQTAAIEQAQDEIELLREQIASLQQYLHEQLRQQRAVELELHEANQGLEQMNRENQQLVEKRLLCLREMKEFTRLLTAPGGTDRRALIKRLNKFCNDIALSEESDLIEMNPDCLVAVFRSNKTSKFD